MDLFINEGNSNFNIQSINGSSHFMELVDFENDGDMDILNFRPFIGTTVEWHKNLSQDNYSISDSPNTLRWSF